MPLCGSTIKLFRDKFSNSQIPFSLLGSNSCEVFLSKVGSMVGNERSYDGYDLVESLGGMNRMAKHHGAPSSLVFPKSHKKQENIWAKMATMSNEVSII